MGKSAYAPTLRNTWLSDLLTALNGGTMVTYDGTQPADTTVAPGASNHALATHTLPNPSGDVANQVLTLRAIAAVIIARSGIANWVRFFDALGNALVDGNVGNQTVTLTAAALAGDTHLTVAALAKQAYAGQDLVFSDGGVLKTAHVNTDTAAGATNLPVDALSAGIGNGAASVMVATFDAPNLQANAACPVTGVTFTAPAAGA